uniref:Uncharacterized protein n=1 Tax=Arundo donax TaxID=35708 RepID=A0A0A9F0U4_ARUDO
MQYVLRTVAPRRVWPAIAFRASMACWYKHLSHTVSTSSCDTNRCLIIWKPSKHDNALGQWSSFCQYAYVNRTKFQYSVSM